MNFNKIFFLLLVLFTAKSYSYCEGTIQNKNVTANITFQQVLWGPSSSQSCNVEALNRYFTLNNPCGGTNSTQFVQVVGGSCNYNNLTNSFQFTGTVQCVLCKKKIDGTIPAYE
jgi:hypothetical protein